MNLPQFPIPLFERLRFVLVETSRPGNIGAAARAMKTMGFSDLVLVNPRILKANGRHVYEEGCLSVPGIYEEVERAEHIDFEAEDVAGNTIRRSATGLLAVCVQHEMDHLKGKVFVEYLSRLKQTRIRAKFEKEARKKAA